ncbi:hypothetical protein Nepgr_008056 [Nepenthes gracilis]|uniref:Uncharacterized protein n=1 Tax=Nepenthes gracilis TaxID=150966 RepID=A0AAD3S8W4_NEPGR|nr:hypothetical protein Nepgr_008056 [Nepenthes gracilis]
MAVGAAVLVLQEVNWLFWPTVLLMWKIMHGWVADMDEASVGAADCVSAANAGVAVSGLGGLTLLAFSWSSLVQGTDHEVQFVSLA